MWHQRSPSVWHRWLVELWRKWQRKWVRKRKLERKKTSRHSCRGTMSVNPPLDGRRRDTGWMCLLVFLRKRRWLLVEDTRQTVNPRKHPRMHRSPSEISHWLSSRNSARIGHRFSACISQRAGFGTESRSTHSDPQSKPRLVKDTHPQSIHPREELELLMPTYHLHLLLL